MRIQSGWAKGMQLKAPTNMETRPTAAKVRAAVFDMLRFRVEVETVVDLFAGSGAIGLEALSQGASQAHFVESAKASYQVLRSNLLAFEAQARKNGRQISLHPYHADVRQFCQSFAARGSVQLVWADPPYQLVADFLADLCGFAEKVLSEQGIFVLESQAKDAARITNFLQESPVLVLVKQKIYGDTAITIAERHANS